MASKRKRKGAQASRESEPQTLEEMRARVAAKLQQRGIAARAIAEQGPAIIEGAILGYLDKLLSDD